MFIVADCNYSSYTLLFITIFMCPLAGYPNLVYMYMLHLPAGMPKFNVFIRTATKPTC